MSKKYKIKIRKPNAGYSGSCLQNNYGESEKKGFLLWDIENKNKWDVEFHELPNKHPFVSVDWAGNIQDTVQSIINTRGEKAFLPGTRFRIISSQSIPSIEVRKIIHELKDVRGASEVVFKYDLVSRMEHITTNNLKISKKSLRQDPDAVVDLYKNYIRVHAENYNFTNEHIDSAKSLIHSYMNKMAMAELDNTNSDITWSIRSFEFDNLFRYGEGNRIDFTDLNGIVGIFGKNKIGKSSIIGALMYTLFNATDRGSIKNAYIINRKKNWCRGKVRISIGADEYVIERQSTRAISKRSQKEDEQKTTSTVNLYKVEWDEATGEEKLVTKNSVSRDETDKVIRKLIGTPGDFLLTCLASQGHVDTFIKEGPTERKNILARFLDLDIFKNLEEMVKKDYNVLNVRSTLLSAESITNQISKLKKEISGLEQEIDLLDEKNNKLQSQKDELKLWLMHHEKNAAEVDLVQLEKLEKSISENVSLLETKNEQIKNLKEVLSTNQKRLTVVKNSKKKVDVQSLKQQLEDLEDVKSTLNELKHELSTQEDKFNSQKKNVRKLDLVPCGDQFPQCYYIKDAHADKARIEKQEALVKTLSGQVEQHQKKLNGYLQKRIKETIDTWQSLDREEFELIKKIESDSQRKTLLEDEIENAKQQNKKLKLELSTLQKRVNILEGKEFEYKKEQLDKVSNKCRENDTARQNSLVSLGGKKEKLTSLFSEQEETKNIIEKLKIYDSIQSAFSKTGIPAMVLESQLPAINVELSKILMGVTDFKITLETEVNSNVMDVFIEDVHSRRIIELASGMERTIASIALRVALINLSSLSKSDMIILDESFGPLDEDNVQSCMEMLAFLKNYFKTILLITHVPQVKEVAEKIIDIKNDGTDSFVEVG